MSAFDLDAVKWRLDELHHGAYAISDVEDDLTALVAVATIAAALAHVVETAHGPNRDLIINTVLNEYWRTVGVEP